MRASAASGHLTSICYAPVTKSSTVVTVWGQNVTRMHHAMTCIVCKHGDDEENYTQEDTSKACTQYGNF